MISLKEYQDIAVNELVKSVSDLLVKDASNKVCVFLKILALIHLMNEVNEKNISETIITSWDLLNS